MKELPEVGKTRLAEYKAIKKKVDAKAERLTREELNMPKDEWWFGYAIRSGSTRRKSCARNTT